MTAISNDTLANILFRLHWEEHGVRHEDSFYAQNVNLWRDVFPAGLEKEILGLEEGQSRHVDLKPGAHMPVRDMRKVVTVPRTAFKVAPELPPIVPTQGRFYPQGVLRGLPASIRRISSRSDHQCRRGHADRRSEPSPGRCGGAARNHALAVWSKQAEFGGQCQDWICALTDGPGLKRKADRGTDFGLDVPLEKPLGEGDAASTPRRARSPCGQPGTGEYRQSLCAPVVWPEKGTGPHVRLAVTSSGWRHGSGPWHERGGDEREPGPVVPSGARLNVDPALPFADRAFDAVICSLSVEYLTRPWRSSVRSPACLSRWALRHGLFTPLVPDQAVKIWTEMHEFERAGLVTEYFRQSGGFKDLTTLSNGAGRGPWTPGTATTVDPAFGPRACGLGHGA